ncbi:HD domain-containing protein [Candidatus Woesearchaeota archaeon]|nr:HD domain-containing protein [Candidatus Woesearchaeota archaeon]
MTYEPINKNVAEAYKSVMRVFDKIDLPYHNTTHVLDVASVADTISLRLGLNPLQREKVNIAALFHDIGMYYGAKGHEEKSAEIAYSYLVRAGFGNSYAHDVANAILPTKLFPNGPTGGFTTPGDYLLGKILCDADVDNFGRSDFFSLGELVRQEIGVTDPLAWSKSSLNLLNAHKFYTWESGSSRDVQKQKNVAELEERILQYA